MSLIHIILLAIALAMDAFAVAIATGVSLKKVSPRQTFRLSWHFGLFQAMMPVMGWAAGLSVKDVIEKYDHWAAFTLLALVAFNMLRGACLKEEEKEEEGNAKDPTRGISLVMLSFATSIDALAVGFSISVLNISIWTPVVIIGLTAGMFTVAGLQIGRMIGGMRRVSSYTEAAGAFVLLGIGLNILYRHGVFS